MARRLDAEHAIAPVALGVRLLLLLLAFALCVSCATGGEVSEAGDEQCEEPGHCTGSRPLWTSLDDVEEDGLVDFLGCTGSDDPRSVVTYCMATRPSTSDCDFEAAPPEGQTAESPEYLDWRKGCLHRCIFARPDLNVLDVSDQAVALLSPLGRSAYKATPFLDTRSLRHGLDSCQYVVPVLQLQELATWGIGRSLDIGGRPVGEGVHFIFHLGHTSSTLLSRALGEANNTFVLREPPLLPWTTDTFKNASNKELLGLWRSPLLPFLSRRQNSAETVVVKAKSSALRLMWPALKSGTSSRAVFLHGTLRTHLTVGLAREQERLPDEQYEALTVKASVFTKYSATSEAFLALSVTKRMALAWMKSLLFAMSMPKQRVHRLSMDDFLTDPVRHLTEVASFLGLSLGRQAANAIVGNESIWGVYAKDTSLPWGSAMQQRLMQGRSAAFEAGIEEGLHFANELIAQHKSLLKLERLLGL